MNYGFTYQLDIQYTTEMAQLEQKKEWKGRKF